MDVRKILLFTSFVLGNLSILIVTLVILTIYTTKGGVATELAQAQVTTNNSDTYNLYPQSIQPNIPVLPSGQLVVADSRPELIDKFFSRHNSPMTGLGNVVVTTADKYQIPFTLVPAIAFCEGNAGLSSPAGSYNTWGWAVYGGKVLGFASWQDGIETVSKGLRTDYYNYGLDTPEKMMPKYTPPSQGTWANCVDTFSQEILNP